MTITPLEAWIAQKTGLNAGEWSIAALRRYQLAKLCETIATARRKSPFYRQLFADLSGDLSRIEDIARLPFTTADDLRKNPLQFLCVSQGEIERCVTLPSSGTTGDAKRVFFTEEDLELTTDFFHIGMSTFTKPGDRVLILLPGDRPGSVGDLLEKALTRLGAAGIKHGPVADSLATLEVMQRQEINCLVGIPAQVLRLVRTGEATKQPPPAIRNVLLSTDYVPVSLVHSVEEAWSCRVYNHYGMTEMGLGGGVDCTVRQGCHVREADLYFEIIDPATGEPQPAGSIGEVVFTTLTRRGMPLIRYRTGDLARMVDKPCPCGSVLPRLEHIRGRLGAGVPIGSGCFLTIQTLDEVLFSLPEVTDYRATLSRQDDSACLNLDIETLIPCNARTLRDSIHQTLQQCPSLHCAFREGNLRIGNIAFNKGGSWFTDGTAKRKIFPVSTAKQDDHGNKGLCRQDTEG